MDYNLALRLEKNAEKSGFNVKLQIIIDYLFKVS